MKEKIRVQVLGSTGMLGHAVISKLSADPRFYVQALCRNPRGAEVQFDALTPNLSLILHNVDYVINCIGLIKQVRFSDRREMFLINSVFPWILHVYMSSTP